MRRGMPPRRGAQTAGQIVSTSTTAETRIPSVLHEIRSRARSRCLGRGCRAFPLSKRTEAPLSFGCLA
eukprot:2077053-Pleurochrysis_carterae.AAC.1